MRSSFQQAAQEAQQENDINRCESGRDEGEGALIQLAPGQFELQGGHGKPKRNQRHGKKGEEVGPVMLRLAARRADQRQEHAHNIKEYASPGRTQIPQKLALEVKRRWERLIFAHIGEGIIGDKTPESTPKGIRRGGHPVETAINWCRQAAQR
jgi:hypothetical protein